MRAPDFWYPQNDSNATTVWSAIATRLLVPAASVYDLVSQARQKFTESHEASVPVICIGNLTAGGTGKTPIAIALGNALKEKGRVPFFLTRGYGGEEEGPMLVDIEQHDCRQVGDEALMLSAHAPTIVSKNRAEGAYLACSLGADMIVMDDGFQNPSLKKNFSILIVDGELAFGNGHIIPAGPLRERAEAGLKRADQIMVARKDGVPFHARTNDLLEDLDVIDIRLRCPNTNQGMGRKAIAFAGIAQPEKFFAAVRSQGFEIVGTQSLADHHNYENEEFRTLLDWSNQRQAVLITTEKDAYRLNPDQRALVEVLPLQVFFERPEDFNQLLTRLQIDSSDPIGRKS